MIEVGVTPPYIPTVHNCAARGSDSSALDCKQSNVRLPLRALSDLDTLGLAERVTHKLAHRRDGALSRARADLIAAVNLALRFKARLPGRWKDEISSCIAAQAIVDQVLLSNFEVRQGPPQAPRSTHGPAAQNGQAAGAP